MHQEQTVSSKRGHVRVHIYLSWVLNHTDTSEVKCRLISCVGSIYLPLIISLRWFSGRASIITVLFGDPPLCCEEIIWLADLKLLEIIGIRALEIEVML